MKNVLSFSKHVYKELRIFFTMTCFGLFPRFIFIGGKRLTYATANRITILRVLLVIPIYFFLEEKNLVMAVISTITAIILDFADGLTAMIHKILKFKDDPVLGAFIDAFMDKVFTILVLLMTVRRYCLYESGVLLVDYAVYVSSSFVILIEIILGFIRIQDYISVRKWQRDLNFLKPQKDLRAKMSGKVKMFLQSVGVILFVAGVYFVGSASLILSVPFGVLSIIDKIKK